MDEPEHHWRAIWVLFGTTLASSSGAVQTDSLEFYGNVSGGFVADEALKQSAGRETQIWKMTEVLVGLRYKDTDSPWSARIEWLPLTDDLCYERDNAICVDYYKNIGTSLLYYGEHDVREAAVAYLGDDWSIDIGRIINPYGLPLDQAPYRHRHDAPHAYYIDKELVNGVNVSGQLNRWQASLGVFGGRGDPGTSYNLYLGGQVDPNLKGNNTPLFEATLAYKRVKPKNTQTVYAGFHYTRIGSAAGSLYSGKHNDERAQIGLDFTFSPNTTLISSYRLLAQYSHYTFGLTTNGTQGRSTRTESRDLVKTGTFATAVMVFASKYEVAFTYEELDRIDTLVWDKVANFDSSHPAFDSIERNQILSLTYLLNPHVEIAGFYRQSDFDYAFVSNVDKQSGTDKYGVLVNFSF